AEAVEDSGVAVLSASDRGSLASRLQDDVQVTRESSDWDGPYSESKFPRARGRKRTGATVGLLTDAGLPPLVHCAKPCPTPPLKRMRCVRRAISQAPAAPWPRVGAGAGSPCGARASEVRSPMNELLLDYLPLVIFIAVALAIALVLLLVPFL